MKNSARNSIIILLIISMVTLFSIAVLAEDGNSSTDDITPDGIRKLMKDLNFENTGTEDVLDKVEKLISSDVPPGIVKNVVEYATSTDNVKVLKSLEDLKKAVDRGLPPGKAMQEVTGSNYSVEDNKETVRTKSKDRKRNKNKETKKKQKRKEIKEENKTQVNVQAKDRGANKGKKGSMNSKQKSPSQRSDKNRGPKKKGKNQNKGKKKGKGNKKKRNKGK